MVICERDSTFGSLFVVILAFCDQNENDSRIKNNHKDQI